MEVSIVSAASTGLIALTMTPGDTLTVIAAVAALVTTIGAVIVNIIIAWRTSNKVDVNAVAMDKQTIKIDNTLAEAKVIKGHVDGMTTKHETEITALHREIELLKAIRAEDTKVAAVLASKVPTIVDIKLDKLEGEQ